VAEPERFLRIDGGGDAAQVHHRVLHAVCTHAGLTA
jgi:hypothetical protein